MTTAKPLFLILLLAFSAPLFAVDGTWLALAPMPDPRQEVAVAEVGGLIYAVGGLPRTNRVQQYDPQANTWRIVAPLPTAVDHAAAVGLAGKLYVMGGSTDNGDSSALFEYDPGVDRWTRRSAMPTARNALAAATIDGKIYAVGGTSPTQRDLEVYDPAVDSWTRLPAMPTGRNHLAAAATSGKLYVVGGRNNTNFTQDVLEVFDPGAERWSTAASMPTGRSGHGAAAVSDRIYVFGGEGNPRHPLGVFPENEVYEVATDQWKSLPPLPTPRHGIGAAAIGNRIYVPAGATREGGGTHVGTHEAFVVQPEKLVFAHFTTEVGSEILLAGAGFPGGAVVTLEFRDQSGQPMGVLGTFADLRYFVESSVVARISAGGTTRVQIFRPEAAATPPSDPTLPELRIEVGSVLLNSDVPISGLLFLGRTIPGLSATRPLSRVFFPVRRDFVIALNSAIAIANPGSLSASLALILRSETGAELSRVQLSVPPGGQTVNLVERIFPTASLGPVFTGTVSVQSSTPVAILALLFRGDSVTVLPVTGE